MKLPEWLGGTLWGEEIGFCTPDYFFDIIGLMCSLVTSLNFWILSGIILLSILIHKKRRHRKNEKELM